MVDELVFEQMIQLTYNMVYDYLSTLLVGRLTRLLDLNCLEELKALEECGYVKQNMELQSDDDFNCTLVYETQQIPVLKNFNHKRPMFKSLSRKEVHQPDYGLVIPREKLEAIVQLIDFLKTDVGAEGLFRISGNKKRQSELKHFIEKGRDINLGVNELPYNTHDIAGILKEFFGDLKEPLLTKQLYDCYQQLAGKCKDMDSEVAYERKLETLRTLFLLLPPLNRFLLKKLIELLAVVADCPGNKMDAYNLGVVFAPNIICTRQVTGSSEFTDNVEPFTDLMKFIIENSSEVFKIPDDFLQEANEYQEKLNLQQVKNDDVPMTRTYCQRIDSKEYRKEAQTNTNEAIALLYQQILDMPDGSTKSEFLAKFYESYPGTPMFIPKAMRNTLSSSCEGLLGTPNSYCEDMEDICCTGTSHENLLDPPLSDAQTNAASSVKVPSSPGAKLKNCLKRVRRTSQDILNPKSCKIPLPDDLHSNQIILKPSVDDSRCTRVKNKLRSYKNSAMKTLRRSLSSPTLINTEKESSSREMNPRELFRDDTILHNSLDAFKDECGECVDASISRLHSRNGRTSQSMDELNSTDDGTFFDGNVNDCERCNSVNELSKDDIKSCIPRDTKYGISNLAFDENTIHNDRIPPIIRKSLYPQTRIGVVKDPSKMVDSNIVRTPIVCKRHDDKKGVPLVNKSLTLENMRKLRERRLLAENTSSVNKTLKMKKENPANTDLLCEEKLFSDISAPKADTTNINLNKFRHISLHDSPRSDAKEVIPKKEGLSSLNIRKKRTEDDRNFMDKNSDEILAIDSLNKLYNKQIITSI